MICVICFKMAEEHEYFSLTIGGAKVHNWMLQGKAQKLNDLGEPAFNTDGTPYLEYIKKDEALKRVVKEFATRKFIYNKTDREIQLIFNDLKTILKNAKHFILLYSKGAYTAVFTKSPHTLVDNCKRFQSLKKIFTDDSTPDYEVRNRLKNIYMTLRKVYDVKNWIKFITRPEKTLYGSNNKALIWYYSEQQLPGAPVISDEEAQAYGTPCKFEELFGNFDDLSEWGYGPCDAGEGPYTCEEITDTSEMVETAETVTNYLRQNPGFFEEEAMCLVPPPSPSSLTSKVKCKWILDNDLNFEGYLNRSGGMFEVDKRRGKII